MRKNKEGKEITPIQSIENAEFSLIAVSWKGTLTMVKVRELSDIQIQAIGNLSLISTDETPISQDIRAWENFASQQHKIVRASLVSPTYEELFSVIGKNGLADSAEETFKELHREIATMQAGPQRKAFEQQASSLRALFDLVLPNDFTASVTGYALGTARTDIKLITKDILWECYVLQKRCGGRPSDYCSGVFSDFNKRDIDGAALCEGDKRMELENKKAGRR